MYIILVVFFLSVSHTITYFTLTLQTLFRSQRLVPGRARSPTDHTFLLSIKGRRAQLDAVTESALGRPRRDGPCSRPRPLGRSEEHTSELQSHSDLVCRLLLEKKKDTIHILI